MSLLFTLLKTENYFSGNDLREISFVIRKVLMFMGQTYVSQRYRPLSTRSFRWFALWPHIACIFSYGDALVSGAETLIRARKKQ
jgi:hypothetical protein